MHTVGVLSRNVAATGSCGEDSARVAVASVVVSTDVEPEGRMAPDRRAHPSVDPYKESYYIRFDVSLPSKRGVCSSHACMLKPAQKHATALAAQGRSHRHSREMQL